MKLNNRGQMSMANVAVSAVVAFVIIAIGMSLASNVYVATGQEPQFSNLWSIAVAGAVILSILIGAFVVRGFQG